MKKIVFTFMIFVCSQSAWSINTEYVSYATHAAQKWGVDPVLVLAVMETESHFHPNAVSKENAEGLMQLTPETAKRFGVRKPFDPQDNIDGGVKYLRYLLDLFNNDVKLTVAAYNAGEHNVMKYKGIPPFAETIEYVKRVQRYYQQISTSQIVEEYP